MKPVRVNRITLATMSISITLMNRLLTMVITAKDTGKASAMLDHDHHCCSGVTLLSAGVPLPGLLPQAEGWLRIWRATRPSMPLASNALIGLSRSELARRGFAHLPDVIVVMRMGWFTTWF